MKGQRKKALWAKKRAENAARRQAEREASLPTKKKRRTFTELRPREPKFVITEGMAKTASLPSVQSPAKPVTKRVKPTAKFSVEEYKRREAAAHLETERKKKMVAPMANKMGYQYIGDAPPEIIKTLGRKV